MAGTIYPLGIDGFAQLPIVIDGASPIRAKDVNLLRDAIIAVEKELGINPSGTYSTVRARLDALESLIALLPGSGGSGSGTSLLLDFISLALESPVDKTYNLVTNIPYDGYMFSVATKSSAGTATGTTLINGVPLGGGTNAISTTQDVVFHSTDRTFVPGDDIQFAVSANAGALDVVATMVFIRFVEVTAVGGSGDGYVQSSASPSIDNAVTRYDGTTGQVIQDSGVIVDDTANMIGVNTLAVNVAGAPNSTLQVDGSFSLRVRTVAVTSSIASTDSAILIDAALGDVDLTLPLASSSTGRSYNIKRIDSSVNTVRILRSGGDTIDGDPFKTLVIQYEAYEFVSDGSDWFIF